MPRIRPEPRHARDPLARLARRGRRCDRARPPAGAPCSCSHGSAARSSGTTDNDYEERDLDHVPASDDDVDYLLEAVNAFFATELGPGRPDGRLRGRAPADLHRRPEEVGGHLAQGRALRDQLGSRDDHRREAHHLAADGQDGGGPARGARGPRGALPHARDTARPADRPGGAAGGARRGRVEPRAPRRALRPRRARGHGAGRRRPGARRAREPGACPTWWPRPPSRRGASRCCRSRTCCCGAPGSACSTRASCPLRTPTAPFARRGRWRRELGWSDERVQAELAGWREVARAEGLVPSLPRWSALEAPEEAA